MSNITFNFDITPSYFRKNGWFKCDNTFKFVSWCFSRCSSIEKTILHDNQTHKLKPFQFIFGRYKCSEETRDQGGIFQRDTDSNDSGKVSNTVSA